jgi:hypothetical protein
VRGIAAVLSVVVFSACQQGGSGAAPTASAPSVARHDLSGAWLGVPVPPLAVPPPMTPKGQALFDAAKPMYGSRSVPVVNSDDPLVTCDPLGMPRSVLHETRGVEFMQAPDKVVLLQQYQRVFREAWTDGRPLPTDVGGTGPDSPDPRRYGYSIGSWADDSTFVVQTTGAIDTSYGDLYAHPHSLGARIEERYRRVDEGTLELTVTIDDPEMYQRPFVAMTQLLKRAKEFDEQLCIPSEAKRYLEIMAVPAAGK